MLDLDMFVTCFMMLLKVIMGGGMYACRNCNNIKFPLYVLKILKLCLFCLPMLVDYCSHKLFAYKMPMHRKYVRLRCVCHVFYDALFALQLLPFM